MNPFVYWIAEQYACEYVGSTGKRILSMRDQIYRDIMEKWNER